MGNKPMGTAFWVLAIIGALLALIIIAGLIGSAGHKTPAPVDNPEAVKNYYAQLEQLKDEVTTNYNRAANAAANGDISAAYADFKSKAGQSVRGGTQLLFELKMKAPDGPNKQLLEDAAKNLWLSFGQREDAVNLFIEGVEKSTPGKFEEARVKARKADAYLNTANNLLEQISNRYGINK